MKFNKLNQNCFYLEIGNKVILISYESIIGLIENNILYISEHYLNFSNTTNKHISLFKQNLNYENEIIINNEQLYKLVNVI